MSEDLNTLRDRLDEVDRRILGALADRQRLVAEVTRLKEAGEGDKLRDARREEQILTRLVDTAKPLGLDGFFVTRLFREILDHSVRGQQEALSDQDAGEAGETVVVAYQGTEGAYSHMAAARHFSAREKDVVLEGHDSFLAMLEAVKGGSARYGVLPIENTTAGSINEAYDLLARMDLSLVGEEIQKVDHCLVSLEAVPLSHIRRVYSHPQALAQCSELLGSLRDCKVEAFTDTAMSVQKIRDEADLSQAAIASEEAARLYGLHVLKRGIANQAENYTRMVIVAAEPVKYDLRVATKTSLIFSTRHEEGALLACMNVLADHHLNLTKLESRPRPKTPWEYIFYVDIEGNVADENVTAALRELSGFTSFMKVLGSYPARTTREARPAAPRPPRREGAGAARRSVEVSSPDAATLESLSKKPYRLASRAQRSEDTVIPIGECMVGGPNPVVIAGPAVVETREQIRECARVIKENGGSILRGGCFESRTSAHFVDGVGYDAFAMLEDVGREYGLPVATEVFHPEDVGKLARRADLLIIGERNMQNHALLKAAGQVDRPVMLRRGTMASVDEWLTAADHILSNGNQMVMLCERGIRTFETATRNTLDLSAIPVVRELTHLPVLVDPSQAVGVRRWIQPMAEAAIASGAHGVVLEVHPEPANALGGGQQALTFDMFRDFMHRLPDGD